MTLEDVWRHSGILRFARDRTTEELWGFCKDCYYPDVCKAGCSWTAHTFMGRRSNMPICYHRVIQLRRKGIRERLAIAVPPAMIGPDLMIALMSMTHNPP